ncbi:hypothetical protein [Nostoc favosum]|uniref:Uncharacterized protein n=1 Tax=Nostoc favosum CHAB5714 TaxID=2780399 RepID=A0ABS8IHG9_9NOSO|nr:hypothetical protein [Nostoc favosum]MCC5603356.1 hypothetical protein [Nostoc favosum CHAB5714]
MFTPDQINLSALASLPLEHRKALPECSGIYFVIDGQGMNGTKKSYSLYTITITSINRMKQWTEICDRYFL